jgi:hypothetical protein
MLDETQVSPRPMFNDEVLNFTPSASINKRLTRYVFTAGDYITERRKYDFKDGDRNAGGEELPSKCLWRVKGYVRRGRITPVEIGPEWHSKEELAESDVNSALNAGQVTISAKGTPEFYGIDVLPGDEIAAITTPDDAMNGIAKGIVELTPLIGRDWVQDPVLGTDASIWKLQQWLFPQYPTLPITLREFQALINSASGGVDGFDSRDLEIINEQANASCYDFRMWGTNAIESENQLIASRIGVGGFTYKYSDVTKVLMKQLEIQPLTISEMKEKAAGLDKESITQIAATVAAVMGQSEKPAVFSLDDLKEMVRNNPEAMREIFAEVVPRNKGGRPPKVEDGV